MNKFEQTLCTEALDLSPTGVVILDSDDRIQWMNMTMAAFLGVRAASAVGQTEKDFYRGIMQPYDENARIWQIQRDGQRSQRWLLAVGSSLSKGGKVQYYSDATELVNLRTRAQSLEDQLESTATNDPLTGVLNRRALMMALEPQVSRSRRYNNPLSVILMEVESFKSTNNAVTPVTEHVLKGVSFFLRDQLRWVDLVGRTDDREFTLVLPETRIGDAEVLAGKIKERMVQMSLPENPDVTVNINVQFGITEWRKGDDTNMLLRRARETLGKPLAESA